MTEDTRPTTTLIDGRVVSTWSEEWRHECEARYVMDKPTKALRRKYLEEIERKRSRAARDRLEKTMLAIHRA